MNICRSIEHHALKYPQKTALIYCDVSISYSELNKSVNKVANGLRSLGIKKSDKVAIMLPNIPEFIYLFYACQKLNVTAVTINTMYKGNEVLHILKDSEAKAIVCLTNFAPSINEILPDLPNLKHIITTGERTILFADPKGTLYLQIVLKKTTTRNIDDLYKQIGNAITECLKQLGINGVWYSHRGGIRLNNGRKIGGIIIYEIEDVYIVYSVIFTSNIDFSNYLSAVWVPPEVRDKVVEPISSIEEQLGRKVNEDELIKRVIAVFEKRLNITLINGKMTREEHFGYEKQRALASKVIKKKRIRVSMFQKILGLFIKKGKTS